MKSTIEDHERRISALEEFVLLFKSSLKGSGGASSSSPVIVVPTTTSGPRKGLFVVKVTKTEAENKLAQIIYSKISANQIASNENSAQTVIWLNFVAGARVDTILEKAIQQSNALNKIVVLLIPGKIQISLTDTLKRDTRVFQFMLGDYWTLENPLNGEQQQMLDSILRTSTINCSVCERLANNACGLDCKVSFYCGQLCAQQHWEEGHWKFH
jgi:hypothetical protein